MNPGLQAPQKTATFFLSTPITFVESLESGYESTLRIPRAQFYGKVNLEGSILKLAAIGSVQKIALPPLLSLNVF